MIRKEPNFGADMRVIAGSARRLNLVTPKGNNTRPTSDKIKETLFNILAPDLYGVRFLDLYAGSGGIGIEALSRGAKSCTFVERDKEAVKCIKKNLETTHFTDNSVVMASDVNSALYNLRVKERFDIVFMDPPYDQDLYASTLSVIKSLDIIDKDTMIIAEAAADNDFSFATSLGYEITRIKEYKNNKHVFIKLMEG